MNNTTVPFVNQDDQAKYDALYKRYLVENCQISTISVTDSLGHDRVAGKWSEVYSPKRDRKYITTVRASFQGHVVKLSVKYQTNQPSPIHKRGKVAGFSPSSRHRLLEMFNRLAPTNRPKFLTLTYPGIFPTVTVAKTHLRAFLERLRRKYGETISGVWRLEFQERGAPHFHLILFGMPFVPKEDIQNWWGEIIKAERPFTRIEGINSHRGLMFYVSKYVAKQQSFTGFNSPTYLHDEPDGSQEVGRFWGVFNRPKMPFAELIELDAKFVFSKFMQVRNLAAKVFPPLAEYISLGFTLYVPSARQWSEIFQYLYSEPLRDSKPNLKF